MSESNVMSVPCKNNTSWDYVVNIVDLCIVSVQNHHIRKAWWEIQCNGDIVWSVGCPMKHIKFLQSWHLSQCLLETGAKASSQTWPGTRLQNAVFGEQCPATTGNLTFHKNTCHYFHHITGNLAVTSQLFSVAVQYSKCSLTSHILCCAWMTSLNLISFVEMLQQ